MSDGRLHCDGPWWYLLVKRWGKNGGMAFFSLNILGQEGNWGCTRDDLFQDVWNTLQRKEISKTWNACSSQELKSTT